MRGFHRSFLFTIKCLKSTVSEDEEHTHHTLFGTQTSRDRQAGRPDPHPARGPPTATHTLISLLCSQPWSTWGLEAGRGPCNHTKSKPPALKPSTQGRRGWGRTLHILVSLADSCSSLVSVSHGDIHISTQVESTRHQWAPAAHTKQPRPTAGLFIST